MVIEIIRPKSVRTDLFYKQTSLNLVLFNKNMGNFKEKIFQNVKYQFVNGDLPMEVVRLISWIILCCYVILM